MIFVMYCKLPRNVTFASLMGCQTSSPCNNLNLRLRFVLIDSSSDELPT